jgi:hypothetical protein
MSSSSQCTYRCNICNKYYKTRQSLWNHNNRYHKDDNNHISDRNDYDVNFNLNSVHFDNHLDNHNDDLSKIYKCKKCKKEFNNYQNRWRHEKNCKKDISIDEKELLKNTIIKQTEELNLIKSLMYKQEQQNQEMKKTLMELLNKNCKVHPKTLQKINKQLNLNGDYNTINNGTVNNTYNIIALGHENLTDVFSRKEKMAILKYRYCSLPQLVEYTHFNDKYPGSFRTTRLLTLLKDAPQFKNILITNTQNTLAYKFDNKKKKFITVNKNDLLDDIIDERMCDLSSFYDELENDLDEKTKEILEIVKEKIESDLGS